jgi:hypothetical protein
MKRLELPFGKRPQKRALVEDISQVVDDSFGLGSADESHDLLLALAEPISLSAKPLDLRAHLQQLSLHLGELSRNSNGAIIMRATRRVAQHWSGHVYETGRFILLRDRCQTHRVFPTAWVAE